MSSDASKLETIYAIAAEWTARRDRGLSAAEAIEFELWLAADVRHQAAMQLSRDVWSCLDRAPDTLAQRELQNASRRRAWRRRGLAGSLALAAAALAIGAFIWRAEATRPLSPAPQTLTAAGPRVVTLADGTLVRLNAGGEVVEEFSPAQRRVRLLRGEAHFTVEKNPAWPFVVQAGTLQVRAVGTAFNVNLQRARVEVVVTEGTVQLATDARQLAAPSLVEAGERAIVSSEPSLDQGAAPTITVSRLDPAALTEALAWHDSLIRLRGATLAELVVEFEQRFGERVVLADPEIARLRAGGRLRSDDAPGFAELLATTFDLDVERRADGAWELRKKKTDLTAKNAESAKN